MQTVEKTQAEMSLTSLQEILINLSDSSVQQASVISALQEDFSAKSSSFSEMYGKAESEKQTLFKSLVENTSMIADLSLDYFSSIQNFLSNAYKKVGNTLYPKWMVEEDMVNKYNSFFITVTEIRDLMYLVTDMMGVDKKIANDKITLENATENPNLVVKENYTSLGFLEKIASGLDTYHEKIITKFDSVIESIKKIPKAKSDNKKEKDDGSGMSLSDLKNFKLPNPSDIIKLVTSLGSLVKLVKPAFNKAMVALNNNLDNLLTKVDEKRVELFTTGIDKMVDSMTKLRDIAKPLALNMALVSLSMLAFTLIPLTPNFIMTLGLFTGVVWVLTKLTSDKKVPDGMQQFGIGIAAMTAGMLLLNFVNYESLFKMLGFVYLLGFALQSYKQRKAYPDMILFSTSITIMTAALIMMNFVNWSSIFMLPTFVFLLGASLSTFGSLTKAKSSNLLTLSYGIGILTLSLVAMTAVNWTAPMLLLGFVSSLLFVVWAFNKNNKGGGKMGMSPITNFAFGIGILTLTLFALQEVEWETVGKAVVFVGMMALLTKIGAGTRTKGMIGFATGLGILTLTMFAMQEIDYSTVFKTVLFVGGLGLALRLFPKTGVPMMWSIAGGIGIMTLSMIGFKLSGFTWEDGLTFVGTIAGLAAVVALVGLAAPVTGVGSAIMIVMGAAALIFAGSLWLINKMDIDKERIDNFGSMLVNLSIAYAKATPYAILGIVSSALFIPIGAASIISAGALMAISALTITPENIDNFAYGIKAISLSYAKALPSIILGVISSALFLPVAAISLATAGVLHLIGKADIKQEQLDAFGKGMKSIVDSVNQFGIIQLGKVMVKSKELLPLMDLSLKMSQTMKNIGDSKVSPSDMDSFADTIVMYVDRMTKVINDSVSKVKGAKEGIEAIASITGVAYTLADTINKMANMEIVTHGVKDGQLVVTNVRKFDFKTDMEKIAPNIGLMISALTEPLIKLVSSSDEIVIGGVKIKNPFSKKNRKGIEFIKNIGDAYTPIVDSVNTLAQLEISRDPKLLQQFKSSLMEVTDTLIFVYDKLMNVQANESTIKVVENITAFVKSFSGASNIKDFNTEIKDTLTLLSDNGKWNKITGNLDKVVTRVEKISKSVNNLNMDKIAAFERNLRLLLEKNNSDKLVELLERLLELMGLIRDGQNGGTGTTFTSTTPPRESNVVVQQPVVKGNMDTSKIDQMIEIMSTGLRGIMEGLDGTNARLMGTLKVKNVDGSPSNSVR